MLIKPSTALAEDYDAISNMARETGQPIYITKEGESDLVVMDVDAYELQLARDKFRSEMLLSEIDNLRNGTSYSIDEAFSLLEERRKVRNAV